MKSPQQRSRLALFFCYLIISVLSFGIYINSLDGEFLFDDPKVITHNKDVVGNSSLVEIFSHNYWGEDMGAAYSSHFSYRPLTILTFKLNYLMHKLSVQGFHLMNLLLHMFVSMLFFACCCKLLFKHSLWWSFLCAIIFALHPIHTEAVSSIAGRSELLGALFALLAFLTYISCLTNKGQSTCWRRFFVSICCILLGLLAKEASITIFAIIIIYDIWFVSQFKLTNIYNFKLHKPLFRRCFLLTCCLGSMLFARFKLHNNDTVIYDKMTNPANHIKDPQSKILTKAYYNGFHTRLLVWPWPLSSDRSSQSLPIIQSFFDPNNLYAICSLLGFFLILVYAFRRKNHFHKSTYLVALSWLVIPFVPVAGWFFDIGFVTAERVLYLSSMGASLLLTLVGIDLYSYFSMKKTKIMIPVTLIALCITYATITWNRNYDWKDTKSLFSSVLKHYPKNAKAHFNYGYDIAQTDEKLSRYHYQKALTIEPDYVSPYQNLCASYLKKNEFKKGIPICTEAIKAYRRNPTVSISATALYFNLGLGHLRSGNFSSALQQFNTCIRVNPRAQKCHNYIGYIRKQSG